MFTGTSLPAGICFSMLSNPRVLPCESRHMHGVPAVIYVLENTSLRSGFCKIGITRRSGWAKAIELNRDIHNSIPGKFECVLELQTQDGGAVLEEVLRELQYCRRGKKEQNFFEAEPARVRETVQRVVAAIAQKNQARRGQSPALPRHLEAEIRLEAPKDERVAARGLFKKAFRWIATS